MAAYYVQNINCPHKMNPWNPLIAAGHMPAPYYGLRLAPVPVIVDPQVIAMPVYTYTNAIRPYPTTDVLNLSSHSYNESIREHSEEQVVPTTILNYLQDDINYIRPEENTNIDKSIFNRNTKKNYVVTDTLEDYLSLPRELFPPARTIMIDPNPVIDVFCKVKNIINHAPWLLDLEFGIPKAPITRPLPLYNVKFSSINCKNTPDAIHPGFEMCCPELKKIIQFCYDCVISAWYRGYVELKHDKSVENFQSWLLLPMQVLGMCWP
ncbi:uncharacterized protein LOC113523135 [Galleria mellonella]|uniref:Uncharacterized protein LOC113523135 n=1 Tax=Galleria mellonella TaxID=7137 RepID=A0A6J1X9B0_GALME|nr:uncharacterized protein LOC113523135 [Galleria mellonella]XP_031766675.2 uncharacterized protein LOC113523135 [Galleria mellonella]